MAGRAWFSRFRGKQKSLSDEPLTPEERASASRWQRRRRRTDRHRFNGLAAPAAMRKAPASLYVKHGLCTYDEDGRRVILGWVSAPPRQEKVTPKRWLELKAARAKTLTPDGVQRRPGGEIIAIDEAVV